MKKYTWLLIDLDDTLFDYRKSEAVALEKTFIEFFGFFNKEVHRKYDEFNKEAWKLFQEAKISVEELKLNRFIKMIKLFADGKHVDAELLSEKYMSNLSKQAFLLDGAEELLKNLYNNNYKLSVITNGVKTNQLSRIKLAGVGKYFDEIILSEDAGQAKPHKQYFDYAKSKTGFENDKTLVIGDNLESDIKGGNDYGLDTCWFNYYRDGNPLSIQPTYEVNNFIQLNELLFNGKP